MDLVFDGRALSITGIKINIIPVRAVLQELACYSLWGLAGTAAYLLIIQVNIFTGFYFFIFNRNIEIPFLMFPISLNVILVLLYPLRSYKEDILSLKSFRSFSVIIISYILIFTSLVFISFASRDISVLSLIDDISSSAGSIKLLPASILFIVAAFFILNELKLNDHFLLESVKLEKLFFFFLLTYFSILFLFFTGIQILDDSVGKLIIKFEIFKNYPVAGDFMSSGEGKDQSFIYIARMVVLWVLFSSVAFFVSIVQKIMPGMNLKYRIVVLLSVSIPVIIGNIVFLVVLR